MRIFLGLIGIAAFAAAAFVWSEARAIPQQIAALIIAVIGMLGVCGAAVVDAIVSASDRQIAMLHEGNAIARLERKERKVNEREEA